MKIKTQKPLRIRVHVRQRHIDAGCEGSPENCPVANACREAIEAYLDASPLGRALLKYPSDVSTQVSSGDELSLELVDTDNNCIFKFIVETMKEIDRIDAFIFAFDEGLQEAIAELKDLLLDKEPSAVIREQRTTILKLKRDVRPFSFWVVVAN